MDSMKNFVMKVCLGQMMANLGNVERGGARETLANMVRTREQLSELVLGYQATWQAMMSQSIHIPAVVSTVRLLQLRSASLSLPSRQSRALRSSLP